MRFIFILLIGILVCTSVFANTGAGYTEVNSATGWKIWKKELNGGAIYVQEIDITKRQLRFVHETPNIDVFPKFILKDKFASMSNVLSLSNGAFFEDTSGNNTGLSYGYKVQWNTFTHGWSTPRDESSLRMFVYNIHSGTGITPPSRSVKIVPYSRAEFDNFSNQTVVVGLSPYYNADGTNWSKRSTSKIGRTFIGVRGNIVYILNADEITQNNARLELFSSFGLYNDQIIMLDGANSTQLSFKKRNGQQEDFTGCRFNPLSITCIRGDRLVPQAIAVF